MVDKNELHDDDIVRDEEASDALDQDLELEAEEELTQEKFKKLRQKLKVSESEKRAALEESARIRADFLNSKRRLEEQFKTDKERVTFRVVEDFLPLMDSFEMALGAREEGGEWRKGVEAMHAQFLNILKGYDIHEIASAGSPFNPHEHEAVSSQKGTQGETPDTVLHVLQKGYKRGDTIIRPARVIIAE